MTKATGLYVKQGPDGVLKLRPNYPLIGPGDVNVDGALVRDQAYLASLASANREYRKSIRVYRRILRKNSTVLRAGSQYREAGYAAFANFMAGVTWAMACRAFLRLYKGHTPLGGVRPQHGAPWTPRELIEAAKLTGDNPNPLTARTWVQLAENW